MSVRKVFVTSLVWSLFLWYLFDDHWNLSIWLQTVVLYVMLVLVYAMTLTTIRQIHDDTNMARRDQHSEDTEPLTLSTYGSNIHFAWENDQIIQSRAGGLSDDAVQLEVLDCPDDSE